MSAWSSVLGNIWRGGRGEGGEREGWEGGKRGMKEEGERERRTYLKVAQEE